MARVNKALAAKKARDASMYYAGTLDGDNYTSHYEQGHQAYRNGHKLSSTWHIHKQQGWRSAYHSDEKFLQQLKLDYELSGREPNSEVIFKVADRLAKVA